ncbi:MAG: MerR family transcriptional regulator [Oscillospiraceae bacterium]
MQIKEACQITGLTKKAVEYYIEKGLVAPVAAENGYRLFQSNDIKTLKQLSVLRRLGLGTQDMKAALADETGEALRALAVHRRLLHQRQQAETQLLEQLACDKNYRAAEEKLAALEGCKTISEKLLEAFPGYYGRFICLHFARF